MLRFLIAAFFTVATVSAHKHAEKQPLVFGIFSEHCYSKLTQESGITRFLGDIDCIKFSVSKLVGYLIVLGAVIVKVPQILKISANGSTKGINPFSYYVETTGYL
jgi:mannose-P-dolichol utilization defect protein 1